MNRHGGLFLLIVFLMTLWAPATQGAEVTHPDRESTYPSGVENVTHAPWSPRAGEDVRVTLTMKADAAQPNRVSLLYCRVEPEYVCGLPVMMERDGAGREWRAVVEWDDRFMKPETRHLGYNLTLRYADPQSESGVRRVAAPLGNHWIPETYPSDADGTYYFFAYHGSADSPALSLPVAFFVVVLAALAARRGPRGGTRV